MAKTQRKPSVADLAAVLKRQRRGGKTLEVQPSPSITGAYYRDLNKLVRAMADLVRTTVVPVLEKYQFQYVRTTAGRGLQVRDDSFSLELSNAYLGLKREFEDLSRTAARVARARMEGANVYHRQKFVGQFKAMAGVDLNQVYDPTMKVGGRLIDMGSRPTVERAIQNNVDLIKTIPEQHMAKIQNIVTKGVVNGNDAHSIRKAILEVNGQNSRRAKLIARDQMQKLNGVLNQARQQDVGVDNYIWRTSQDERVRESHRENDGRKFSWDKPPAETGHPGEDINCRCVAEPDLSAIVPIITSSPSPVGSGAITQTPSVGKTRKQWLSEVGLG